MLSRSIRKRGVKPAGAEKSFSPMRVLVVDDDSLTLTVVGEMVESLGLRVDLAMGGPAALCQARQTCYDVVLTDYQMPEVDGCALAAWVKAHCQDTLVFVMTGCSPAEVEDHRRDGSVDHWIFKPFNLGQLRERLAGHGLLGHHRG